MTKRISISKLQDNPTKYLHECHHEPIEVVKYGKTLGYIVPPSVVETRTLFVGSLNINNSSLKEEHEQEHAHNP